MNTAAPLEAVERLIDAINTGRADAALQVCSESATITTPDGGTVTGQEALRAFVTALAGRHAHFQLDQAEVQDDTVTGILEIANDYHRQVGVAPLQIAFHATVGDGAVISFGGPFTPASLDKLQPLRVSEQFYAALTEVLQGNPGPMVEVWSHGSDVSTMHPLGGRQSGWEQVRQGWEQAAHLLSGGAAALEPVTVADLVLVRPSDDIAYTLGTEQVKGTVGGQHIAFQARVTNVYRREDGAWKVIHYHADALPSAVLAALTASADER